MVEIRVEGVGKFYGKTEVLDDITFSVADGEFAVLLGPSGCGKTTLLRCVAGLEKVDSGEIYLGNELANDLPPRERDLAMVFQSFSLFPVMSVRENIAFPLKVRGATQQAADEKVREVARILSIENLLDKTPKQISGGEQQRVAIGRAIAREPKAFLMDEPLSSLDAPLRAQLRSELKRIQKEIGATTLYVTHDQAEALALADKIGVLNKGSLLQFGTPQTVFENPSSAFVARFVGDPQANILNVSLVSGESPGMFALQAEGFRLPVTDSAAKILSESAKPAESAGEEGHFQVSVRPEDIQLLATKESEELAEAMVFLDEPLTLYRLVTVRVGGTDSGGSASVRVLAGRESKLLPGHKVWLRFNPSRFHFFERKTGKFLA